MAKEVKTRGTTVDVTSAAALVGVTPRWIQRLAAAGWITPSGRGRYPLVGVVQGHIRSLKDEQSHAAKGVADERLRDARAAEIEQRIAAKAATLIRRDEAEQALVLMSQIYLESVDRLPGLIAANACPSERKRVAAIVAPIRKRLAKSFAKRLQELETGQPADEG